GLYYALPASAPLGNRGEGLPIHTYGVLLISGFLLATAIAAKLAEREWQGEEGIRRRDDMVDYSFWALVGGSVGSRLLFVVVNWKDYSGHWVESFTDIGKFLDMLGGGLVFYGGLIGAAVLAVVFTRQRGIPFLRFMDVALPAVSIGQCFGRLG